MRADRLISLVLLLRNRGLMSASQLAGELEVSERTVLRDIEALSTSGFPVYAERGRHGGFQLLPGFTTDLTGLTAPEATALLAADVSASLGMSAAFSSAMRKVLAALPDEQRRHASSVANRVLVRPDGWIRDRAVDEYLEVVQQSVFEGRRLRMDYAGRDGANRTRTIDPLGLVYAAGIWYLLATDNGQARTYRVSRIARAEVSDEQAVRESAYDIAAAWDARREDFRSSRNLVEARIRVRRDHLEQVAGTAVRIGEPVDVLEDPLREGWVEVEVLLGGESHAGYLAWMLAENCEIVAPASLRSGIRRQAERMILAYE